MPAYSRRMVSNSATNAGSAIASCQAASSSSRAATRASGMKRPPKSAEAPPLVGVEPVSALAHRDALPVMLRTAVSGSPSVTSASPTSTTAAPCAMKPATSAGLLMPDSATLTRSSGTSGASRAKVSGPRQGLEVAGVDPDQLGAERDRALGLGLVVDLHQHRQAQPAGLVVQRAELVVAQRRHDQQREVGSGGTGLHQLVVGDDEVLAQDRDVHGRPDGARSASSRRSAAARSGR